jgi:hypothetical protein
MIEFIWSLLSGFVQVFLYGGFIIFGLKYYEWYDDRLVAKRSGRWAAKQNIRTVEIVPPIDSALLISEMQSLFTEIYGISGNRTPDEIYSTGAGFFNIAFDIIGHNSQVQYFLTMESSRLDLTVSFLKQHYPTIEVRDTVHPFKSWPQEWWDQDGLNGLRAYRGADIVPAKTDLHPLKSYKKFYNSSGGLVNDPMNVLMNTLKNMPADGYLVMQYIFRPHPGVLATRVKGWEDTIQKLKKEFIDNNSVEKIGANVQTLTQEEEEILQNAIVKMKSIQYRTKLRWMLIYDKKSGTVDEGNIKKGIGAYFQDLSTSVQSVKDSDATNTEKRYPGGMFGPLDAVVGNWMNRIYWTTTERSYRMRRLYSALINQSLDTGEDSSNFFLDPESIASLLHFPQSKTTITINPVYTQPQQQQTTSDGRHVVIQQYQPAFYIQHPDGTQVPVGSMQPVQIINSNTTGQAVLDGANQTMQSSFIALQNQNQTDIKHQPPEDLPT